MMKRKHKDWQEEEEDRTLEGAGGRRRTQEEEDTRGREENEGQGWSVRSHHALGRVLDANITVAQIEARRDSLGAH